MSVDARTRTRVPACVVCYCVSVPYDGTPVALSRTGTERKKDEQRMKEKKYKKEVNLRKKKGSEEKGMEKRKRMNEKKGKKEER